MIEKIENVFDKYVRPQLSMHYGDVKIISFDGGVLKIKLMGQCSNCLSAKFTVEDIIEKELKEKLPEVKKVVLIEGVSDELLAFAKKILKKEAD